MSTTTPATTVRERTYSWGDPAELARAFGNLSGIELLTAIGEGRLPLPPAGVTAGIVPVDVSDGAAVFELTPEQWHENPMGTVHGGILSTLADTALGCAVQTKLPAGTGYTSLDLTVKFTRAATVRSGTIRCDARVVSFGRRIATAEATITDLRGRVVAHAVTSCLIMPGSSTA